ncbi:MAG: Na+/H+ antiporter subunit C [Deinococcales bacterium]
MESLLSITVGLLFASAIYLMLRRNLIKFIFGLSLLSNAINLLIFSLGRLSQGLPPIVPEEDKIIHGKVIVDFANPLPQALILTAIVISFGFTAFALVLLYRNYRQRDTLNTEKLKASPLEEVYLCHQGSGGQG